MSDNARRLAHVDGLRGLAIGLVMLSHAWTQHPPYLWDPIWWHNKMRLTEQATALDWIAMRGYQGVSLFLVLSGFCLAYPAICRRQEGQECWFRPSHFFARRVLRILPPYYAALALGIALLWLFHHERWPTIRAMDTARLSASNIATHVLLIHNFTSDAYSIVSPFWSLGLEWQWYWLFPVVLLLSLRYPVPTIMGSFFLAVFWESITEDLPVQMSWLPGRLFEFCCGVLVARLVARGFRFSPALLFLAAVAALVAAEVPIGTFIGDMGLYQPLYGIAFSSLLLLTFASDRTRCLFSWQPLVRLGVISYSVYLVHRPVSDIVESFAPYWLRSTELLIPVAMASGLIAGILFHLLVERPCMRPQTWMMVGPTLQRLLAWTDRIYRTPSESRAPSVGEPAPARSAT